MNTTQSPPLPARPFALPNLLTYARIAAVPVVVGLLYWQSILDGGLWIRWVALAVFMAGAARPYGVVRRKRAASMDRPVGMAPPLTLQVKEPLPPVADSCWLKPTPR